MLKIQRKSKIYTKFYFSKITTVILENILYFSLFWQEIEICSLKSGILLFLNSEVIFFHLTTNNIVWIFFQVNKHHHY